MAASQLLKQRYRILSQVAGGGFATVYKAEDTQLGSRLVAIKKMDKSNPSPQEIADFKREALTLASLPQHPNLPNVYEHFDEAGAWYIVMSFIEGETLEDYLDKTIGKLLPPEEVINIGIQLSTVMEFLHDQHPPIIFRDLKPSNIMRTSKGHLYLIDFGIARHFDPLRNNTSALGTIGYAAPEQAGKNPKATPLSDIFALGATLHELLSGNDPANNPFTFAPLGLASQFSSLEALILQMVNMNANQRPASMADIRQKLNDINIQNQPVAGQSSPFTPPATAQSGKCSSCGLQNPVGTAFCDNCGMYLLGTAPPPVTPNSPQQPAPKSPVQVQAILNPIAVPNQQPVPYNRLDRMVIALVNGGIAGVSALILTWLLSNITQNYWILILLGCIVSCLASFITTWQAERKWAGVFSAFVTVITFGILLIIISSFDLISAFGLLPPSEIGAVFLSFLIIALIDMLPAFIGAWLATLVRSSSSRKKWIIGYFVFLLFLVGIVFLLLPLAQSPLSPQSSFVPITQNSFRTWFWWVVGSLPSVLLGVIAAYKNLSPPDPEAAEVLGVGAGMPLGVSLILSFFSSFLINLLHLPQALLISIGVGAIPTLLGTLYFLIAEFSY